MLDENDKEAEELIEKIYKFKKEYCKDLHILDVILEYAEVYDIPVQEIGNIISEHKEYVNILEKELIKDGYIIKEETMDSEFELSETDDWE